MSHALIVSGAPPLGLPARDMFRRANSSIKEQLSGVAMLPIKMLIPNQALDLVQVEYIRLTVNVYPALILIQAPTEQSSDIVPSEGSQLGTSEQILQWNHPEEQSSSLNLQMEEARLDSREIPMVMDTSGPSPPEAEQEPTQQKSYNAPQATHISVPSPAFDIGGSSGSASNRILKSISPTTTSGGFPTFEHTFNSNPQDSPDIRGILTSGSSSHRSEKEEFQDIFSELMTGTEHETAFLTRHYSESIGPWYVLFLRGGSFDQWLIFPSGWIYQMLGSSLPFMFQSGLSTLCL